MTERSVMFLSGSNIDAVNAEIATCGDTAHERVSACGPLGSDPAVYMHTNERERWDVEFHSTIHLQWLTCLTLVEALVEGSSSRKFSGFTCATSRPRSSPASK